MMNNLQNNQKSDTPPMGYGLKWLSNITANVKYMASWGLKCATLSSQTKVN